MKKKVAYIILTIAGLIAVMCYQCFRLTDKKEHYISVYYDSSSDQIVIENQKENTFFYAVGGNNIERYPIVLPPGYYQGFEDRLYDKVITDNVYLHKISTDLPDGFYEIQVFLADIGYTQFDREHSYFDSFYVEKKSGVLIIKVYLGNRISENGPVYSTTEYLLD